jgi:anaerobic ribonucleoside-triphosphate reductase activating protein
VLKLYACDPAVRVLGPGTRAAIWVQGCPIACSGCISRHSWDRDGGRSVTVDAVAEWISRCDGIEGVTFSGGEPMEQASALARLVDRIRADRDLGVVCYTGYPLERLRRSEQRALLSRVDLLIDGPYRQDLHADLLWRASSNQRLRCLSPRYAALLAGQPDRSGGLDFHLSPEGLPSFVGVPPRPGFLDAFARNLQSRGVRLQPIDRPDPSLEVFS